MHPNVPHAEDCAPVFDKSTGAKINILEFLSSGNEVNNLKALELLSNIIAPRYAVTQVQTVTFPIDNLEKFLEAEVRPRKTTTNRISFQYIRLKRRENHRIRAVSIWWEHDDSPIFNLMFKFGVDYEIKLRGWKDKPDGYHLILTERRRTVNSQRLVLMRLGLDKNGILRAIDVFVSRAKSSATEWRSHLRIHHAILNESEETYVMEPARLKTKIVYRGGVDE